MDDSYIKRYSCIICDEYVPLHAINPDRAVLVFNWDENTIFLHKKCFNCPCGIPDRNIKLRWHDDGKFNYLVHEGYDGSACKFKYKLPKCIICHARIEWGKLPIHSHGLIVHHSCITSEICSFCERPFQGLTRDVREVHRGFGFAHRDCNSEDLRNAWCCTSHKVYLDSYGGRNYDSLARKLYTSLKESVTKHVRDCFPERKGISYNQTCQNRDNRYKVIISTMQCKKSGMNILYQLLLMKSKQESPISRLPVEIIVMIGRLIFDVPQLQLKRIKSI